MDSSGATLDNFIDSISADLISFRRELHKNPELSFEEYKTTEKILSYLQQNEITGTKFPKTTGLSVKIPTEKQHNGKTTKTLMLRADIDALPIQDEKSVDYRSRQEGVMHACGHDVHSSILAGALTALNKKRQELPINIKGIFQPAEELGEGALSLIEQNVLDDVDYAIGLHVDPNLPVGTVAVRSGPINAAFIGFEFVFTGKSAHGGRPHLGIDAIAATAQFITNCYALLPRTNDAREPLVVHFGSIHGGSRPNIVAETCTVQGALRCFNHEVGKQALDQLKKIGESIAIMFNGTFELQVKTNMAPVVNNPEISDVLFRSACEVVGQDRVITNLPESMGGEDFGAYMLHKPSAMFRLGIAKLGEQAPALHTPMFDIEEEAIIIGSKIMARAAFEIDSPLLDC